MTGSLPQQQRHDHFSTRSIHVGSEPDPSTGAVVPSLSVATTFKQDGIGKMRGYDYSRSGNPTRSALEELLTSLETSPSGAVSQDSRSDASIGESLVFASGSAATAAVAHWVTLSAKEGGAGGKDGSIGGGGHILSVNDVYGGTARYLARTARPTGLEVTFLDFEKAGKDGIREAIRPDTRLIWLEIPTNPLLLVPPLRLIRDVVHSLPAATRPLILIDTTFLSSFYITPLLSDGDNNSPPLADIAYSSLSKYSGGHSDIILGSLTVSPLTASLRPNLLKGLRFLQNSLGASPSPRDCHLLIRSLKTLSVRMIKHGLNALRVAAWLNDHPAVERVRYPGLKTDGAFREISHLISPNAKRELEFLGWLFPASGTSDLSSNGDTTTSTTNGHSENGSAIQDQTHNLNSLAYVRTLGIPFGGVITFAIKDASAEGAERFCTTLRIATLAESLGGVESLVEVPYGMTHSHLPQETLSTLGITPNLIRLSVGIEDYDDIVDDLQRGLAAVAATEKV